MVNMSMDPTLRSQEFLETLSARSQDIFRRLVERYIETGEPVGSRAISKMLDMQLSPASVRNVMADLEELGLIAAPHTSAGRAPTQEGLRFFVDAMLEIGAVDEVERNQIARNISGGAGQGGKLEDLLNEASVLLSGLSQGAGMVIAAKSDMVLRHIEFVRLDPERAMAILVGADGQVENRIIALPPGLTPSALTQASNFLAHHIAGKTLKQARDAIRNQSEKQRIELDEITQRLVDSGLASMIDAESGTPTLIVRGRANLIDDTMASEDLARVRQLFDEIESKKGLIELLNDAETAQGVRIFIGSENKLFSLSGSSVVLSPYKDANDKVIGVLGVIGPTRLNYARIVPVVDYTAHVVSRLIGKKG